ncbi:class I SAM-dependent methyltransferase [Roseibacterium sp. SDUM158017]|uniref:class I SAM-dependent methyltransferase n=1 Tax=Roseicyclus salinarum TaxID=3036773 RepID=UPI00241518D7|nr:class I SAM-dependent methyltransferase [Roseibacterium sp. SDUM158017]MDG4649871.1 class I SAM-dependent methyltransferase [Roseibacterium sp. SDUM158017]
MTPDRWTLALENGALAPAGGRLLALMPRGEADLAAFAGADITAVQGFRPDHDRLQSRGFDVVPELEDAAPGFDAALVQIVKSRVRTLAAVAEALSLLKPGGLLMVDGAKEEGIEAILKAVRALLPVDEVYSKAHGKLFWLHRPEELPGELAEWIALPETIAAGYVTAPGGFSADAPDRGSEILVALAPALKGRVADLGAGWGYVAGEVLAEQEGIEYLDLIEADHAMLEAARANVDDPRAAFHWADATRFEPSEPYDAILCNPPFHTGRRADPDLGRAFIAAATRMLSPSGKFIMVANRHLPYEAALKEAFATGRQIGELEGYKLYEASKPRRASGRTSGGRKR